MFLVDTNIWLELILEQEKANEVRAFFKKRKPSELAITEFSIYSIGIIMTKLRQDKKYLDFLEDTVDNPEISRLTLSAESLKEIPKITQKFGLDFDDAYQYIAAKDFGFTLVSFDTDFDRTDRGRKPPSQLL